METLKVSTKSNPNSVAGALAGVVRERGVVEMQVVGAGALNQAVKAIAIARSYVASSGIDLVCVPSFTEVEIDGDHRTAIRLLVEHRDKPTSVPAANRSRPRADHPDAVRGLAAGEPAGGHEPELGSGPDPVAG